MAKRKKKSRRRYQDRKIIPATEVRLDQILLNERTILLFGDIDVDMSYDIVERLLALDKISGSAIFLAINSPGGSVSDGLAIIDAIRGIRSPVITFITGEACSMAGLISITGDERWISHTAVWMGHDLSGGIGGDYTTKVIDRAKYLEKCQKQLNELMSKYTKLTEKDIEKATHGELWLNAYEALQKGVVDKVVGGDKNEKPKKNK